MDNPTSLNTIDYFQSTTPYFWKWAEKGKVIEFANGTTVGRANGKTICYREDLTFVLESLTLPRLVPLGTFILLFCACKNDFESNYALQVAFNNIALNVRSLGDGRKIINEVSRDAFAFLKLVNSLPYKYRMGLKRIPLYQAIFEGAESGNVNDLKVALNEFKTGELDEVLFFRTRHVSFENFEADLRPLVDALKRFPDKESLELVLRTGLKDVPGAANGIATPEPVPADLFDALEADARTIGLSNLARFITGALSIPMHLSGSSDQSVGGVSDISNRGHYDKLLLSELAQDDLLLTARLANNEALFLQREELPLNNSQEWHILLDSTLKMWGVPRVFGLAAGLAFSEGRKSHEPMNAWALGGKQSQPIDLHSKEGVINCLEILDPALNCGLQLGKLLTGQKGVKGKYIMITADHYRDDLDFLAHFLPVKDQLDYLVVVSRTGHIELFETQGGRHKLLNQATIDLDATLFVKKQPARRTQHTAVGLPAFMQSGEFKLYFPASKIKLKHNNNFKAPGGEVFIITQDYRILLWENKDHGAIEIDGCIERGESYWGFDGNERLALLVNNVGNQVVTVYNYGFSDSSWNTCPPLKIKASTVKFHLGSYHLKTDDGIVSIDSLSGEIKLFFTFHLAGAELQDQQLSLASFNNIRVIPHLSVLSQNRKFINNGYSVINSAKRIYLHPMGLICIDHREIRLSPKGDQIKITDSRSDHVGLAGPVKQEPMEVMHLPNIKFTKFKWPNGSEAVLDSRGLLHLKSSDVTVSEISILLVIDKPSACWSSDGNVTGWEYFTGNNPANGVRVIEFYDRYIQPFINGIK